MLAQACMCDKVFLSLPPPSKGGPFPLRNGIGIGRYVDFLCVYFGEQHTTSEQPHCGTEAFCLRTIMNGRVGSLPLADCLN